MELQESTTSRPRKSVPGTYSTGKGTTSRILNYLQGRHGGRYAGEIAKALGVPSRQIHKRLNEQLKRGALVKTDGMYFRADTEVDFFLHQDFPSDTFF